MPRLLLLVLVASAVVGSAATAAPSSPATLRGSTDLHGVVDGGRGPAETMSDDHRAAGWWSSFGRRHLTATGGTPPPPTMPADGWPAGVVVEQAGGGNFKTIGEALEAAAAGDGIYTIRVRAGIYNEVVLVTRMNVVLIGDGINRTVITGAKSNKTGTAMLDTATVTVLGHGFMAQDLSIRNTAGPEARQALAFRSNSNKFALYRCSIEGNQDTLYSENNLQLYVSCDFIFGNGKAVFVGCRLLVRRPAAGQHNVLTAQGRDQAGHDSGFVFQKCAVLAADDLGDVDTYLGRPWKDRSRVVFMNCYLGDVLNATGWIGWDKDKTVGPAEDLVRYLEYRNTGPKGDPAGRVKWNGVHQIKSAAKAREYTAEVFLDARSWVPSQIPYDSTTLPPVPAPASPPARA